MNPAKKPLIGVVPLADLQKESYWMLPGYFHGIEAAGGVPLMLPMTADKGTLSQILDTVDGLLFPGGHDLSPALDPAASSPLCGEGCPARDETEKALFRLAWERDFPMLGICRGIQLFNVLLGGTLYQDLPAQSPSTVEHHQLSPYDRPIHRVRILPDTPLSALLGTREIAVNSYHHQAVRELAPRLRPMATAPDKLVEAVYAPEKRFVWAVQWHPEFFPAAHTESRKLFAALVQAAYSTSINRPSTNE